MPYKILYTQTAFSDIKKLDSIVKKRLKKKIEIFSKNPINNAKKMIHFSVGSYLWRVGDYRIIFDIEGKTIIILRIRHRRESYK